MTENTASDKEWENLSDEEIFRKYYPGLCHFAWRLLNDRDHCEDIVQDAFFAFWKHKNDISTNSVAIKNFLYTSVRNLCYNTIRHEKIKARYMESFDEDLCEDAKVLDSMIRSEVLSEIHKIMELLPDGCRQIFRMGYLEGLPNPKIAKQLGISINTVKTQKQRGLKIFRAKLNPELFALLLLLTAGR